MSNDIVKQFEEATKHYSEMSKSIRSIQESLQEGIFITNPAFGFINMEPKSEKWQSALDAKLNEFLSAWSHIYPEKRTKGIDLDKLQSYSLLTGGQLLILLSHRPSDMSDKAADDLMRIIEYLNQIGTMRIEIDGGRSLGKFNKIGDSITNDIKALLQKEEVLVDY